MNPVTTRVRDPREWQSMIALPDRLTVLPPRTMPRIFSDLLSRLDRISSAQRDREFQKELAGLIPVLLRLAHALTRDRDAAEDLLQESLTKAWSAREQFEIGTNLRAWTSVILKRLFLSQLRRNRFHGNYDELSAEKILAVPEPQTESIHLTDVEDALASLPTSQRSAILMIALDGLSYEEAASRTGISIGAFKSRVSRGRVTLAALLEENQPIVTTPKAGVPAGAASPRKEKFRRDYASAKAAGRSIVIG